MADYSLILTKKGAELVACALAENKKITVTAMAVGDGGGSAVTPLPTATALKREVYRMTPMLLDSEAGQVIVHGIIPADEGGFAVREVGLYAEDDLVAYGNMAEMYKTTPTQGMATDYNITLYLSIDNDVITISVPPQSYATVGYVDQKIQELEGGTLNVTALNADNLTTGTVPVARLPIATTVEAQTGSITDKLLNPALVKAAMDQFGLFGMANYITSTSPITSMNEFTKSGIYYISTSATQITNRPSTGALWLVVFSLNSNGYVRQWAVDSYSTEQKQWVRHKRAGVWDTVWTSYISPQSYTLATATSSGLMSFLDKQKLDAGKSQWFGTEAQYNALSAYDASTLYYCKEGYQIAKIFLGGAAKVEPPPTSLPITADITHNEFTVPAGGYNKCDWYASNVQGGIYVRIELNFNYDVVYTFIGGDMGGSFEIKPGDVIRYYKEDMQSQETIAITVYQQ